MDKIIEGKAIIASGVFVGIISSLSVYIYSKGKALNHPKK